MTIELSIRGLCNNGKKRNVRNTLSDPRSDAIVIVTTSSLLLNRLRGIVSLMIWI